MIKNANQSGQDWNIWDSMRGLNMDKDERLQPNLSNSEASLDVVDPLAN